MKNIPFLLLLLITACESNPKKTEIATNLDHLLKPAVVTDTLPHDTDDPAIWVHPTDLSKSLILGTDKEENGGVYAFDLQGKIVNQLTPVQRPNNIDVEYGMTLGDTVIDIAVFTERLEEKIRIITLPDMKYIDNGGVPVFRNEPTADFRAPMGVALFKDQLGNISAFVSRKDGPTNGTYIWQYQLMDEEGIVTGQLARKLGLFSGDGEIEALLVDDAGGFLYYSDEAFGIRKYFAHADSSTAELLTFGLDEFNEDREGLCLATVSDQSFIIVSDQQDHSFEVFSSQSKNGKHQPFGNVKLGTVETDGCEVYSDSLSPDFPTGIFVAMSEGRVFHYYRLEEVLSGVSSRLPKNSK